MSQAKQRERARRALGDLTISRPVLDRLIADVTSRSDALIATLVGRLEEVAGYDGVSVETLGTLYAEHLPLIVRIVLDRDLVGRDESLRALGTIGVEARAAQGVGLDAFLQGIHLLAEEIRRAVSESVKRLDLPPDINETVTALVMDFAREAMRVAAEEYHRHDLEVARRDDRARAAFVQRLVFGDASTDEIAAVGLAPDAIYIALRARARWEVLELFERSMPARASILAGMDGDLVGVIRAGTAFHVPDALTVGVGNAATLDGIATSFALATRAVDTAVAFGRTGIVAIEDLGPRAAVLREDHLGGAWITRYLAPLDALGSFGRTIEHTLSVYFEEGMRLDASAKRLFVHTNTLLHRLHRFEQLTGADIRRVETAFEIWWALARRSLAPEGSSRSGAYKGRRV